MEKRISKKIRGSEKGIILPHFTRPVWGEEKMVCKECNYNDQDVDTYPCAKCHVRQ